jgi:hypothetical protein
MPASILKHPPHYTRNESGTITAAYKWIKNNTKLNLIAVAVSLPELGGLPKRKRLEFRG